MSKDPLDNDISVGAELTPTGMKASAKSRTIAAIDRLVGNWVDWVNLPTERRNTEERSRIEGARQLTEAIRDHALERMKIDKDFADRAAENYIRSISVRQQNKDEVANRALEDLRSNPEAEDGASSLDAGFLNSFERHAEDAATEALREKWGRVLAAEIRQPGTISPRVMRIVDELDASTAQLFEKVCLSRLANFVPICLHGKLKSPEIAALVAAELLVDPGFRGQVCYSAKISDLQGRELTFLALGENGVGWRTEVPTSPSELESPLVSHENGPAAPVYVLTTAGHAVSSILPDTQPDAFGRYLAALRAFAPDVPFEQYEAVGDGRWNLVTASMTQIAENSETAAKSLMEQTR